MENIKYLTVSALTRYIRYKFDYDENLKDVLLEGEISNFKRHSSGNFYFTLKDETSQISAMMFLREASKINFVPKDGQKVYLHGSLAVYERGGTYSFIVREMKLSGIGNLYLELEKVKKELEVLGYFRVDRKKPIPKFPRRIGVITSETGAVIRDIINTVRRRYKRTEIVLYPTLVQGETAKISIVNNIIKANTDAYVDVLILARGGGSIEDLWPFNERIVADAIYNSKLPIISAVGHETDFTIADFVADKRAATPTAAAELATPDIVEIIKYIQLLNKSMKRSLENVFRHKKQAILQLERIVEMNNPLKKIAEEKKRLKLRRDLLINLYDNYITNVNNKYQILVNKLELLSPLKIMSKGYSIASINTKTIKSINDVKKDDIIETRVNDGVITSLVSEVKLYE